MVPNTRVIGGVANGAVKALVLLPMETYTKVNGTKIYVMGMERVYSPTGLGLKGDGKTMGGCSPQQTRVGVELLGKELQER